MEDDLNGHIVNLKIKTEDIFAIAESRSPMSFLNEKMALRLQENDQSTVLKCVPREDEARNSACINGE